MKKLRVPSVGSIWKRIQNGNRDSRVLFFSTEAKSLVSLFPSPSQTGDNLYHRIMGAEKQKLSIAPIMDEWVKEGRPIELQILRDIIKRLRKNRFSKYALQIFEWIDESKNLQLSPGDIAIRLDLIGKTYGLDVAEKYFHNIPMNLRTNKVYGALLNCYVHFKNVEKAEDALQKMRDEFGYDQCLAFTLLMNLYSKLGKFDKLHLLAQQVEEMGVIVDKYFQYTRLNAYATARDVTGMESLVK
ncbi:unnamed protein product [Cuscuta epithymum]|uniref:Pentatricopeptide repeat-containing protein n=1 Tax=Cuscuta epithymum TaxID=186058 RepID=A0AAV0D6J5_9ASTE|nr:unnamed protein product [Cuscuta epithymum]